MSRSNVLGFTIWQGKPDRNSERNPKTSFRAKNYEIKSKKTENKLNAYAACVCV